MSTDPEIRSAHPSEARRRLMANLRRLRQRFGWSQEELAARSGLHRTFVSSVERGERNISLDNIDRLAQALQVDVQVLLQQNHPEDEKPKR